MISKSKASVFLEDTLNITGLQRPELIPIAAHLVKSKQAKNVGEAINMLDTGTIDVNEIRDLIIQSYQNEIKKPKEIEAESEIE